MDQRTDHVDPKLGVPTRTKNVAAGGAALLGFVVDAAVGILTLRLFCRVTGRWPDPWVLPIAGVSLAAISPTLESMWAGWRGRLLARQARMRDGQASQSD